MWRPRGLIPRIMANRSADNTILLLPLLLLAGWAYLGGNRARAPAGPGGSGAFSTRPSQETRAAHQAWARQEGRGRDAEAPHRIPGAGWKDIGWRTYRKIGEDRLSNVAGGVVFYMLLAIFPALVVLVSLYGLFADATAIANHLTALAQIVPDETLDLIQTQIVQLIETTQAALSVGFILGLVAAFWSANHGTKAIMDALNVVYDERETRSFLKLNLVAFAFTIGALLFFMAALGAVVVAPIVLAWVGLGENAGALIAALRWPALLLIMLFWLALLYRYGPNRAQPQWRWITPGSIAAAVSWLAVSGAFSWYLSNFADYQATYGSLGAAVGMMMWLWISVMVILVGAALNAEIEHQTARDTVSGRELPLGSRGATMADTVGRKWG
jgi:membrane protein